MCIHFFIPLPNGRIFSLTVFEKFGTRRFLKISYVVDSPISHRDKEGNL